MSSESFVLTSFDPTQNLLDPDLDPRSFRGEIPEPFARRATLIQIGFDLLIFDNGEGCLVGAVDPLGGSNPDPPGATLPNLINYTKREFTFTLTPDMLPETGTEIIVFFTPVDASTEFSDFTVLNFDGLLAALNTLIQRNETWKDVYNSNQGQALLQAIAFVAAGNNFMVIRRAQESYIKTARLRSSLIRLAEFLDFRVRRKVGSKASVRFSIEQARPTQVIIPKLTRLTGSGGNPFLTTEPALIEVGEVFVDVPVVQGEFVRQDFILPVDVLPSLIIEVGDTSIEDDDDFFSVRIGFDNQLDVDFEEWFRVDNGFIESRQNDPHYEIVQGVNGEQSVRFGDGLFGRIPPGSQAVGTRSIMRVEYIRTKGFDGNVATIGGINSISSTFTDSDILSAQNTTIASGGEDEQPNEEIRELAPAVFRTGDRAVTVEDFISILKNLPGVVLANIWAENENNPPNFEFFNKIEIALVVNSAISSLDWSNPTDAFINQVVSPELERKKVLTTKIFYVPSVEIKVVMELLIFVENGFSIVDVQERVFAALNNFFAVGQRNLGESVFVSSICEVIEDEDGVHHVDIKFLEPFSSVTDDNFIPGGIEEGSNVQVTVEAGNGILPGSVFITYDTDTGLAVIRDDITGEPDVNHGTLIPDPDGSIDGVAASSSPPGPPPTSPFIKYDTGEIDFSIPVGVGAVGLRPINIFYRARLFSPQSEAATVSQVVVETLGEIPVRPGTVKVTYKDDDGNELILIDNGQTQFIVKSQTGTVGLDLGETREVIYETGVMTFTFDVDPTFQTNPSITVEYNSFLDDGGNLILFRDEFATFDVNFEANDIQFRFLPPTFLAQGQ